MVGRIARWLRDEEVKTVIAENAERVRHLAPARSSLLGVQRRNGKFRAE